MVPSKENFPMDPVHLVHPVQNPEPCIPCAAVGEDRHAGSFPPEVPMSSTQQRNRSGGDGRGSRVSGHARFISRLDGAAGEFRGYRKTTSA